MSQVEKFDTASAMLEVKSTLGMLGLAPRSVLKVQGRRYQMGGSGLQLKVLGALILEACF